jgi:hypothetical protein
MAQATAADDERDAACDPTAFHRANVYRVRVDSAVSYPSHGFSGRSAGHMVCPRSTAASGSEVPDRRSPATRF